MFSIYSNDGQGGLERDSLKVDQAVQILDFCDLVVVELELAERCEGVQVLDFLDKVPSEVQPAKGRQKRIRHVTRALERAFKWDTHLSTLTSGSRFSIFPTLWWLRSSS